MNASIRFSHGFLTKIRSELLANTDQEAFAVALGSRQEILGKTNVVIREIFTLDESDYISRSLGHVTPRKEIIMEILSNVTRRLDVDTIIDIHTHPFSNEHVNFSSVDDRDERQFAKFMNQYFDGIHFASIVFSRNRYRARFWEYDENNLTSRRASIKTQTSFENIPESTDYDRVSVNCDFNDSMQARTILALGLDNCRRMTSGQKIVLAGVGGLGSVMAEHLVHLGFSRIGLIDPDCLEISNMNRFVGATLEDAKIGLPKVEVVERHIKSINPNISVDITQECLDHIAARKMMADADWILLSTDNHSSRLSCQTTALEFGIPLISAGVNISVAENKVSDMSGEVITIRLGDNFCLSCLGRINFARIASESHPEQAVREATLARGYVEGIHIKEPAVKTLNTIIGTLAVETLVDQYTKPSGHVPILVYENNGSRRIYEDRESLDVRHKECSLCHVW